MTNITITRALAIAAVAGTGLYGCNDGDSSGSAATGSSYADLEVQLQNCASNALDCVKDANCDDAAEQVCKDEFKTCREETRAAYHAFHLAVKDCFSAARACAADAGNGSDGGANDFRACREQFWSCVQDSKPIRPPAGPCLQGFRDCVQSDEQGKHDCLVEAHTCFVNRLPMCGPDRPTTGGSGGGGGNAGDTTPGAGGTTGTGGTTGSGGAGQ